jgi:hypothetical protein
MCKQNLSGVSDHQLGIKKSLTFSFTVVEWVWLRPPHEKVVLPGVELKVLNFSSNFTLVELILQSTHFDVQLLLSLFP